MTPDPAPDAASASVPDPPWRLLLASLGVLAIGFVVLAVNWGKIPDPVPVHFDGSGEPDRWVPKTWWAVTFLLWLGVGLLALFAGIGALGRVALRPMPVDPARGGVPVPFSRSLADRLGFVFGRVCRGLGLLGLLLSAGLSYTAVASMVPAFEAHCSASFILVLVGSVGGGLAVAAAGVQGMHRARELFPPDEDEQARREVEQDPALYRAGAFYSNPADPMALVHSRMNPENGDFNYAHLPGRVFAVVILLVVVGAVAAVPAGLL